jgi:hypothetical protein
MTEPDTASPATVDDPAFLTALVTEHFVLQTARSIGTGEATSRAGLYAATLSSGLVATGFASGKTYFGVFLGAVIIVVLVLGFVTFARLVEISREDLSQRRQVSLTLPGQKPQPGQLFIHLRAAAFAADRTCLSCSALSPNG